jgi:hypothetical protein
MLAAACCLVAAAACSRARRDEQCLPLDDFDPNRGVEYREAWTDELAYECNKPAAGARVYPDCEGYHVVEEQPADTSRNFYYDVHSGRLAAIVERHVGPPGAAAFAPTRCFGAFVTVSTTLCVRRNDCGNPGGI